jgi:hypothetical protein
MMEGATIVGGIAKLTIEAFTDAACTKEAPGEEPIVALLNPESYTQSFGMLYSDNQAIGSAGEMVPAREKSESLTFALVMDGTGAVPSLPRKSVAQQIRDLRRIGLTMNGTDTYYLVLSWGTLRFKCRMKSLDVTYTLFNPDGSPLRAKVNATFQGAHSIAPAAREKPPAQTGKYVMIEPLATLPAMCRAIYGDERYALDVASANQLDSFRKLIAGEILYFPPLAEISG